MARNTWSRSLHDVGLAVWFGGTLANAVALNPAASAARDNADVGAVANAGWDRWTPVNAAAIGMHLLGSVGQLGGNRGRIGAQRGVGTMVAVKTGLTVAALGVTAYSRVVGQTVSHHTDPPVDSATTPAADTPQDVRSAQTKLRVLQWAVPAVTGALVVVSAFAGEQQRSSAVVSGLARRLHR